MKYLAFVFLCLPITLSAQLQKLKSLGQDKHTQFSVALTNEVVYFQNDDTGGNSSIWATTGTILGTRKISMSSQVGYPFAQNGDSIFFFSRIDFNGNNNLSKYSTQSGYTSIKALQLNASGASPLISFNGTLYFPAISNSKTYLWKSNGTSQGTIPISFDFNLGMYDQINSIIPFQTNLLIGIVRNFLDDNVIYELWNFDPSTETAVNIYSSGKNQYSYPSTPSFANRFGNNHYTVVNNVLYFAGYEDAHGLELWRSDGTSVGTYLLADIDPRSYSNGSITNLAFSTSPDQFFAFNGLVYFSILQNASSPYDNSVSELWVTDGTLGGVSQIQPSVNELGGFDKFSALSSSFVFTYDDEVHGTELWVSNGNSSGTKLLQDLWTGPAPSVKNDDSFFNTGSEIYFSADDGKIGNELWKFDAVTQKIDLVSDGLIGPASSTPRNFRKLNNTLIFTAADAAGVISLYSLDLTQVQLKESTPTPFLPASQWFQTIGNESLISGSQIPAYYNYDLGVDSKNNIYASGQFNGDKTTFYENSAIIKLGSTFENVAHVYKIAPDGTLAWQKLLHASNAYTEYYNGPMLAPTPDDGVVVANSFYSSVGLTWTNYLGLPLLAYPGIYFTKFDGNGNRIWAKYVLTVGQQPYVSAVKTDDDGNTYVTGLYFGGMYWNDQLVLTYKYSPTYFLLKLDPNGNLLWAENVVTGWSDYGKIADMKIDSQNKKIYLLVTEGTRTEWSSCEFQPWHFDIFSATLDGHQKKTKEFTATDFTIASNFDFNEVGDLFIIGRFRGKLTAGNYSVTTPREGDCSATRGFVLQVDSAFNALSLKTVKEPGDPYELKFLPTGSYILSGIIDDEIFINQYDPLNNLLSSKTYNKNPLGYSIVWDFTYNNPIIRFDTDNNFILSDRYTYGFDSVANALSSSAVKTFIMKAPMSYLTPETTHANVDYPIEFFPNPANNRLNIKIWDQSQLKFTVKVYDALGRPVGEPDINNDHEVYYVDVSSFLPGIYFFIFNNGSQRITKKIQINH